MSIQISDVTLYDPSLGKSASKTKSSSLDSSSFMQLLVAQLRFQDPMQGMDQQAFMQQLATMSSMQQQQTINSSLATLVKQSQVTQAAALVGHQVSGTVDGKTVAGQVTAVNAGTDGITLQIGDTSVPFGAVSQIQ